MIGRVFWIGFCVCCALVAAGLQLDRAARHNPALAESIPAPFRGFAQEQRTATALRGEGDASAALSEARALVRKRPVPAEHLALLSLAASRAGDEALANRAIILSAQRGWRHPFAQYVVARGAIAAGEWSVAGDRLYALWASGDPDELVTLATQEVLAEPAGRAAFSRRLAQNPHWRDRYLGWGARHLDPAVYADTVRLAAAAGSRFDCGRLAEQARSAVRRGQPANAAALWIAACRTGDATGGGALDLAPGGTGTPAGPFDWTFPGRGGLSVSVRGTDGGKGVLDYRNTDPFRAVLARRYLRLAPGRYTVRLDLADPPAGPGPGMTIACIGADGARRRILALQLPQEALGELAVPGSGCNAQIAELYAPRGGGKGLRITLSAAQ